MTRSKTLSTLLTDLLDSVSATLGSALISFNSALAYGAGTLGAALKGVSRYSTDTGTLNAMVLTTGDAGVYDGMSVLFKPANTNTIAGVTLNVNSTGAVAVVNNSGAALMAGDLVAGKIYSAVYDVGTSKWWLVSSVASQFSPTSAAVSYQLSSPGAPNATTSFQMEGMGAFGPITPTKTGRLLVIHSGSGQNATAASGFKVTGYYGIGTPPTTNAAPTGTAFTSSIAQNTSNDTNQYCFSISTVLTGLTLGTPYWIDGAFAAFTAGGTGAFVTNLQMTVVEF